MKKSCLDNITTETIGNPRLEDSILDLMKDLEGILDEVPENEQKKEENQ